MSSSLGTAGADPGHSPRTSLSPTAEAPTSPERGRHARMSMNSPWVFISFNCDKGDLINRCRHAPRGVDGPVAASVEKMARVRDDLAGLLFSDVAIARSPGSRPRLTAAVRVLTSFVHSCHSASTTFWVRSTAFFETLDCADDLGECVVRRRFERPPPQGARRSPLGVRLRTCRKP